MTLDSNAAEFNELIDLDKIIHERVRLGIVVALSVSGSLTFKELKQTLQVTDGNLSVHMKLLEKHDYVEVEKSFIGRKPRSSYKLTAKGRLELRKYVQKLEKLIQDIPTDED